MSIHFTFSLYWLLLPLALGLAYWVFAEREDERGGYLSGIEMLFRLPIAVMLLVLGLCVLLAINLWLK